MEKHELVDKNGNKTGKVLTHAEVRDLNNISDGYYISVVGVVVINSKNEILLQKRSKFKRVNPSKWGVCGGKVDFGESPIEAGIREVYEEIGIKIEQEQMNFLCMDIDGKNHFTNYYVKLDVNISECILQKSELEEVKYFKIEELNGLDNEGFEWLDSLKQIIR